MRYLTIPALIALALGAVALVPPAKAGYPYYQPVVVVKEIQQVIVTNLVTVPTPTALFVFHAAPTTPPPVFIAARVQAAPKADPCCASPELTARLARIEQGLASLQPSVGPPALAEGPPRLRPLSQAQAPPPPPIRLHPEIASVVRLLQVRCAECHTSPGRKGIVLFDEEGAFAPNVSKREIQAAVKPYRDNSGALQPPRMPLGKPAHLTADEVALVERWAKAD